MKLIWAYEKGTRVIRSPVLDENGKVVGVRRSVIEDDYISKDNPEDMNVSVKRVWWNPDATDPDTDLRVVYEKCIIPLAYLKKSDMYMNTEDLTASVFTDGDDISSRDGVDKYHLPQETDLIEIYERWDKSTLITYCQGRIIRYRDNPFDDGIIPYFFYRSTPVDNEFVGMGSIEPSLDLEALANTIHNQRIDNVNRIIHKMIFVGSGAGWKGNKRLRFRPGGIEQIMDVSQVREFQLSDVTASAYVEADKATALMDDITGDPPIGRGEQPRPRETATSVSIRTQGASYRIELKTLFAQLELARHYKAMYALERQFGDPLKWVKINGGASTDYVFYHGELFVQNCEFDYTLNGYTGNRLIDFQQFLQGIGALATTGVINEFDTKEIAKVFCERTNMRGAERMLRKPELVMDGYYRDPYDENRRITYYGEAIDVLPGEQHGKHMPIHQMLLDTPGLPEGIKLNMRAHQQQHIAMFIADKQAQMATQAQVMAQSRMIQQAVEGAVPQAPDAMGAAYQMAAGPGGITVGGANNVRR